MLQDFGNVRLVGMSEEEFQSLYNYYYRPNPTTGLTEVWMMPEDVVLNTQRAWSTSTTTLNGYSATLGARTGRYVAPPNSSACLQERPGDCAPRSLQFLAPWFFRLDFGMTKRFTIKGRMNFEVRFDMLNLFDNINFNPALPYDDQLQLLGRCEQLQGEQRLHGCQQHLRPGRPDRPVDVPLQLVAV